MPLKVGCAINRAELFRKSMAALVLLNSAQLLAQAPRGPAIPAPPTNPEQVKTAPPRGQSYLEHRYGLSAQEAAKRIALETKVSEATNNLAAAFPNEFLTAIIDHKPNYSVTMVFSRDVSPNDIQSRIPAELRPYLRTKRSRYTGDQIRSRQKAIADSLRAQNLTGSIAYDYRTDKFDVGIGADDADTALMQKIPADLRSDVIVHRGHASLNQTGVRTGDAIYGGWVLYDNTYTARCTWGFPVLSTTDNVQSIMTADHCPGGQSNVYYSDGHWVTMPMPSIQHRLNSGNRSYDFRVVPSSALKSGPYVWYYNSRSDTYRCYNGSGYSTCSWANVNPVLDPSGGYVRVAGVVLGGAGAGSNQNHPVGAVRCKMGFETGVTCGQITGSAVAVVLSGWTYLDLVQFESPDYAVLSYEGDSGAPVTTDTVWNSSAGYYDVNAAGVEVGGETRSNPDGTTRPCVMPSDGTCRSWYMAIDRINDFEGVRVYVVGGTATP